METLEDEIKEVNDVKIDADKQAVQIVGMLCLTILGLGALIIDGEIGVTISVAVAGAIGFFARDLFNGKEEEDEVQ